MERVLNPLFQRPEWQNFHYAIEKTWNALCQGRLYSIRELEIMLIANSQVSMLAAVMYGNRILTVASDTVQVLENMQHTEGPSPSSATTPCSRRILGGVTHGILSKSITYRLYASN